MRPRKNNAAPSRWRGRFLYLLVVLAGCVLVGLIAARTASAGELEYQQRTTDLALSNTDTTALTSVNVNADGATVQEFMFGGVGEAGTSGGTVTATLYIDGTATGIACIVQRGPTSMTCLRRLIPSAGTHSYVIKAKSSDATGANLRCGAGTGTAYPPCFLRLTDQRGVMTTAACTNAQPCNVAIDSLYNDVDATVSNWPSGFNVNNFPSNQNVTCTSGCSSAGTFTLSDSDKDSLQLSWWGTWAIVGVLLCSIFVGPIMRSFRFWQGD